MRPIVVAPCGCQARVEFTTLGDPVFHPLDETLCPEGTLLRDLLWGVMDAAAEDDLSDEEFDRRIELMSDPSDQWTRHMVSR